MVLQSEEVTYAQLTLPRGRGKGRGYSAMVRQQPADWRGPAPPAARHSLLGGLLSPTAASSSATPTLAAAARTNACFAGPLADTAEEEEAGVTMPLVGSETRAARAGSDSDRDTVRAARALDSDRDTVRAARARSSVVLHSPVTGPGPGSARESKV